MAELESAMVLEWLVPWRWLLRLVALRLGAFSVDARHQRMGS